MKNEEKRKEQPKRDIVMEGYQQSQLPIRESNDASHGEIISASEDLYRMVEEEEAVKVKNLESLGIFAGGIAHDFNNILTIISGNMSLIKMQVKPHGEIAGRLTEMEKAFFRAKSLTQQLITFSTGGEPVKRVICLSKLMYDSTRFSLKGQKTNCLFHIPNEPFFVEVDTEQMEQAINNIIINAVQALPEGGEIEVMIENVILGPRNHLPLPKGKYIKTTIVDHGIGISPENVHKVFVPYFTTKEFNNGLGLSTTYSIIKRHGGYITVSSKKGVGTTFSFYLPALQRGVSLKLDVQKGRVRGENTPLIGKKILVMDDKEEIRNIVKEMLRYISCEAYEAINGEEAISLYTKERDSGKPFDAVILDLMIPNGMDGQETIKRLRRIDPDVKAIVSSGYSNDPIMASYEKYGFTAILPKPYRIKDLKQILQRVITDK